MTAAFTLSVDVEGLWGLFFVRSYVEDTSVAEGGRAALPEMSRVLAERGVPSTFAFVGHLLLPSCGPWPEQGEAGGGAHPGFPRPSYDWYDRDWLADDPGTDEATDPLWYSPSQARAVLDDGHEVGAHGFTHVILETTTVPREVADAEFRGAQDAARGLGLPPLESFVFPQNVIGHEDALAAAGFKCYRDSDGGLPARAGPPGGLGRARNLLRHVAASTPFVGSPRVRDDGVVVLPSSFPLIGREGLRRAVGRAARTARIEKGLTAAAREGKVLHVWTHPHAFGTPAAMDDLRAVADVVAAWRERGDVEVLTMGGLADRARTEAGGS